jgi:membrane-bound inhibitor of C-type lysozyme
MNSLRLGGAAIGVAMLLTACSGSWWPLGRTAADESTRIPAGATDYACANGKRLLVRHTADGKFAWVIYPDREFRLDRVAADSGDRFTNGVSTLSTQGDETMLEEAGTRLYVDCKRKTHGS